jgi:hypothetical protein
VLSPFPAWSALVFVLPTLAHLTEQNKACAVQKPVFPGRFVLDSWRHVDGLRIRHQGKWYMADGHLVPASALSHDNFIQPSIMRNSDRVSQQNRFKWTAEMIPRSFETVSGKKFVPGINTVQIADRELFLLPSTPIVTNFAHFSKLFSL